MAGGDLAVVLVHWQDQHGVMENGFGMQSITTDENWRQLLADEFRVAIIPDWRVLLSVQYQLVDITVKDVDPGTGADGVHIPSGTVSGLANDFAAPANCAFVVSWRSEGIGRSTRGRSFLGGFPNFRLNDSQQWASPTFDLVNDWAAAMLGQYGPTGFSEIARFQVLSRTQEGQPVEPPQPFPIVRADFSLRMRSMRKRLVL